MDGNFPASEIGYACVERVMSEIARVYWNRQQRPWDRYDDPGIPGIEFRPFYWGDSEEEARKPNLVAHGVEIEWYKHSRRGLETRAAMTPDRWSVWLYATLATIWAAEADTGQGDTA